MLIFNHKIFITECYILIVIYVYITLDYHRCKWGHLYWCLNWCKI